MITSTTDTAALNERVAALLFPQFPTYRDGHGNLRHRYPHNGETGPAHNYAGSLDDMELAESTLTESERIGFVLALMEICEAPLGRFGYIFATAEHRALAYLRAKEPESLNAQRAGLSEEG